MCDVIYELPLTSGGKKNSSDGKNSGSVEGGVDGVEQGVPTQQLAVGCVRGVDRGWVDTQGGFDPDQTRVVDE